MKSVSGEHKKVGAITPRLTTPCSYHADSSLCAALPTPRHSSIVTIPQAVGSDVRQSPPCGRSRSLAQAHCAATPRRAPSHRHPRAGLVRRSPALATFADSTAAFERTLIKERQRSGIARTKERDTYGGRTWVRPRRTNNRGAAAGRRG